MSLRIIDGESVEAGGKQRPIWRTNARKPRKGDYGSWNDCKYLMLWAAGRNIDWMAAADAVEPKAAVVFDRNTGECWTNEKLEEYRRKYDGNALEHWRINRKLGLRKAA